MLSVQFAERADTELVVSVVVVHVSVLEIDRPGSFELFTSAQRDFGSLGGLRRITPTAVVDILVAPGGGLVAQRLDQIDWRVVRSALANRRQAHVPSVSAIR